MMDQLAALDRLIDGIEKDEWGDRMMLAFGRFLRFCADAGLRDHHIAAWKANEGCLNSALALHNALLPGWDWCVVSDGEPAGEDPGPFASVDIAPFEQDSPIHQSASTPARAWLLATLRAYRATIAQEATND
jgi:hypothetical protein